MLSRSLNVCKKTFIVVALALCLIHFSQAQDIETVKLATVEWPPYYSDKLENQGYLSEMSKLAFKEVNLNVEVHFMPWMRAMKLVRLGEYHGVLGAYWNEERSQTYFYSDVMAYSYNGFVILKKNVSKIQYDGDLQSLSGYVIGYMKGHIYDDNFDQADFLKKRGANDKIKLISWLLTNQVDLVVGGQPVIMHVAKSSFPAKMNELTPIKPPLSRRELFIIFGREVPGMGVLRNQFNEGLKILKHSPRWKSLAEKHSIEPAPVD